MPGMKKMNKDQAKGYWDKAVKKSAKTAKKAAPKKTMPRKMK